MRARRYSNVVGFDDAPFARDWRGAVPVVGTVYAGARLDGVLVGQVMRDGGDAADSLARLILESRFRQHLQLIMLQGLALAGFNVVDVDRLHTSTGLPVLVVARRQPDPGAIRRALLERVPAGAGKWALIERLGPMQAAGPLWFQVQGLAPQKAREILGRFALHGNLPEPLRVAHLIAGAVGRGESRGRA